MNGYCGEQRLVTDASRLWRRERVGISPPRRLLSLPVEALLKVPFRLIAQASRFKGRANLVGLSRNRRAPLRPREERRGEGGRAGVGWWRGIDPPTPDSGIKLTKCSTLWILRLDFGTFPSNHRLFCFCCKAVFGSRGAQSELGADLCLCFAAPGRGVNR